MNYEVESLVATLALLWSDIQESIILQYSTDDPLLFGLNSVFESFGRPEPDSFSGSNLKRFPGLGVSPFTRVCVDRLEYPKARNRDLQKIRANIEDDGNQLAVTFCESGNDYCSKK